MKPAHFSTFDKWSDLHPLHSYHLEDKDYYLSHGLCACVIVHMRVSTGELRYTIVVYDGEADHVRTSICTYSLIDVLDFISGYTD